MRKNFQYDFGLKIERKKVNCTITFVKEQNYFMRKFALKFINVLLCRITILLNSEDNDFSKEGRLEYLLMILGIKTCIWIKV